MSGLISKNYFDCAGTVIVPVIASFNTDGKIMPLYVRIQGISYKIDSSWMYSNFISTVDFNCKIIDGDSLKPLILIYHRKEGLWSTRI